MAIKFKSSGTRINDPVITRIQVPLPPVGIKTPMALGTDRSGIVAMHFDPVAQVKDNLRNLLLTNKGERLGRFDYGAGLRSLVSELASGDIESSAILQIQDSVSKYMPYVSLEGFSITYDRDDNPQGMTVVVFNLKYSIPRLSSTNNSLSVKIYAIG